MAFVDVDHLKVINDTGGHAAGDRVLRQVADAIRVRMRKYDIVVRYGGDEFLCALAGVDLAGAAERMQRVRAALAEHVRRPVSITFGLAELVGDDTVATLVDRADADLYAVRAAERGPVRRGPAR
jgi:diguanylate cyclase (GGDEF)-like protein